MIELTATTLTKTRADGIEFSIGDRVKIDGTIPGTIVCFMVYCRTQQAGVECDLPGQSARHSCNGHPNIEPEEYVCKAGHGRWSTLEKLTHIE